MRKLLKVVFGYVLAVLAAGATQVLFAVPPHAGADLVTWWNSAGILILAAATHIAIFSFTFAFVAIAIAEWIGRGSWAYYVLTGLAISLGGFFAEYASENATQPTIVNNYALMAFVTTGVNAGLVYWMVAGLGTGRRRPAAPRRRLAVDPGGADDTPPSQPSRGAPEPATANANPAKPMTSVPTTRDAKPRQIRVAEAPAAPAAPTPPAAAKPTTAKA